MNLLRIIVSAIFATVFLAELSSSAMAQIGASSKLAEDYLEDAEKAVRENRFTVAVQNYSRALRAEDMENKQVASVLFRRGSANERAGRPAQAIADLTKALYLPDLPASERSKAYLVRGRAYEAAGLGDQARADIARARSGGVDERTIARSATPAQPAPSSSGATQFETVSDSASRAPSFQTASRSAPTRAPAPSFATSSEVAPPTFQTQSAAARTPAPPRQRTASFQTQSRAAPQQERIPQFRTSILPENSAQSSGAQATSSAETQDKPSGTVGRFFGNLWSNATGNDPQPAPAPTASPPQWQQTTRTAPAPTPQWNSTSAPASAPAARTPAPASSSLARPTVAAGGRGYRIQLAALKSDAEAQATWQRLSKRHPSLLGGRQPVVVPTNLGGLGTFYRLQLGPFTDKAQSQTLCKQFKAGGLDCFLLAP